LNRTLLLLSCLLQFDTTRSCLTFSHAPFLWSCLCVYRALEGTLEATAEDCTTLASTSPQQASVRPALYLHSSVRDTRYDSAYAIPLRAALQQSSSDDHAGVPYLSEESASTPSSPSFAPAVQCMGSHIDTNHSGTDYCSCSAKPRFSRVTSPRAEVIVVKHAESGLGDRVVTMWDFPRCSRMLDQRSLRSGKATFMSCGLFFRCEA
jgi:hypothetical protein